MRSPEYVDLADNCTETPSIVCTKKTNFLSPQLPLKHACSSELHAEIVSQSFIGQEIECGERKRKGAKTYDERSSLSAKAACVPALSRSRH